jgi:serine/threonine-protein kinase RsbW
MLEKSADGSAIRFSFSSDMQLAQEVIQETARFFNALEISQLVGIKVVLHELLKNAIEHGNRNDPALKICCEIERLDEKELRIKVRDEGNGFDFKLLDLRLPDDPRRIRKRGFLIVNSIAERLEFNRKGNQVTVHIALPLSARAEVESPASLQPPCDQAAGERGKTA